MKRRNFIISASIVTIGLPVAYYFKKRISKNDPLIFPELLGSFCNELQLREIGTKYREMIPGENEKLKLTELLLTDINEKKLKTSDNERITEMLNKKIHAEFEGQKTVIIKGWYISVTEARQCALLSLKPNKA